MFEPIIERFRARPGKEFRLKDHDPGWTGDEEFEDLSKAERKDKARIILDKTRDELGEAQAKLYADGRFAVLVILQATDTAGKDGTIKHVMSGVNPQGCSVVDFKRPTAEELAHTFLWRCVRKLPKRGMIGIFNRSYYEDVLVTRVHPDRLGPHVDPEGVDKGFWKDRYDDINNFERHLVRNGTTVLKFYLNLSKGEQKERLLSRIDRPEKNWKFEAADLAERAYWDDYRDAYEKAIAATSTDWAPWYVVPADHKWVTRAVVADVLATTLRELNPQFPKITDEAKAKLAEARRTLENEG